jgi:hypothetical protein
MRAMQAAPLFITWGPFNPSQYEYDASDSLRVADNAAIMAMAGQGVMAADIAAVLYASTNANGQQIPNAALLADGVVHQNGIGYDLTTRAVIAALETALA